MKHSDYHGKLLRLAMFFVALFLCGTMAYAQTDRMISGIVVDENGDPLPAAHIRQVSQTKRGGTGCCHNRYERALPADPAPHSERDRNLLLGL